MPKKTKKSKTKGEKVEVKKVKKKKLFDSEDNKQGISGTLLIVVFTLSVLILAIAFIIYALIFEYTKPVERSNNNKISVPEMTDTPEQEVEPAEETPEQTKPESEQRLRITETPTGYLNVRSGPSTGYEQIDRVSPGDEFVIVGEDAQAGWYEIELSESRTGWVVKTYTELITDN